MSKYQALFLEEAAEHLAEIGRALLDLEKEADSVESIDVIFRMAHSIKSMAASVGYDSVEQVAHALEDRMETIRANGRVPSENVLSVLFRGLEELEQMVEIVRETDESPPPRAELVALLSALPASGPTLEALGVPEPPDAAELDRDLIAVIHALEAESGAKKKLLN